MPQLGALGIEGMACPLLVHQTLTPNLPEATGFAAIAVTSTNALRALRERGMLERYLKLPLYAVGGRTAAAAKELVEEGIAKPILIGDTKGWLGQSLYQGQIAGAFEGAPPPVDLAAERRNGEFVRAQILAGRVSAAHDLADGGLAVALAEMALAGGVGATLHVLPEGAPHAVLFGEDQARYLLAASPENATVIVAAASGAGVPVLTLGVTGGDALKLPGEAPILLSDLRAAVQGCEAGYSNSRGCEIGLSRHGGIPYQSIVYLVDRCTSPPRQPGPPSATR
mgnify:CR=1 FL=1